MPANAEQEVPPPQEVTTDGPFTVTGLPTPATYEVKVERPGFDPQVTRVELNGGQSGVLDTSSLAAANGSITGRVVDGAGNGLGNVKVVLRSGAIEKTIVTPTVGTVGEYTLDGLPTPRTYVITYTLNGFTSATVALDLTGGENKTDVDAQLIGGAGTVIGTVRDVDGNPLGGVKVVVAKGAIDGGDRDAHDRRRRGGRRQLLGRAAFRSRARTPSRSRSTASRARHARSTFLGATDQPTVARRRAAPGQQQRSAEPSTSPVATPTSTSASRSSCPMARRKRTAVTTSTPAGFYSFAGVPDGTYTLRVFGAGVLQHVVRITTSEGVDRDARHHGDREMNTLIASAFPSFIEASGGQTVQGRDLDRQHLGPDRRLHRQGLRSRSAVDRSRPGAPLAVPRRHRHRRSCTSACPPGSPAGMRSITFHVCSENDHSQFALATISLNIAGLPRMTVNLDPVSITSGKRAQFGMVVANKGNARCRSRPAPSIPRIRPSSSSRPPMLHLLPGEQTAVQAQVVAPRRGCGTPKVRVLSFVGTRSTPQTGRPARSRRSARSSNGRGSVAGCCRCSG